MSQYWISGIWQSENPKHVTNVQLHEYFADDNTLSNGIKKTRAQVVALINSGHIVKTCNWNYNNACWSVGARVEIVRVNNVDYLRTVKDATASDNLDNMINMKWLGIP